MKSKDKKFQPHLTPASVSEKVKVLPPPVEEETDVEEVLQWNAELLNKTLSNIFWVLFLFLCMILPLVGKAAMTGSGSPGAVRAIWASQNQVFFGIMWGVTFLLGCGTIFLQWKLAKSGRAVISKMTAGLWLATAGLGIAFALGLLHV